MNIIITITHLQRISKSFHTFAQEEQYLSPLQYHFTTYSIVSGMFYLFFKLRTILATILGIFQGIPICCTMPPV